jgi:hypothetical protein
MAAALSDDPLSLVMFEPEKTLLLCEWVMGYERDCLADLSAPRPCRLTAKVIKAFPEITSQTHNEHYDRWDLVKIYNHAVLLPLIEDVCTVFASFSNWGVTLWGHMLQQHPRVRTIETKKSPENNKYNLIDPLIGYVVSAQPQQIMSCFSPAHRARVCAWAFPAKPADLKVNWLDRSHNVCNRPAQPSLHSGSRRIVTATFEGLQMLYKKYPKGTNIFPVLHSPENRQVS